MIDPSFNRYKIKFEKLDSLKVTKPSVDRVCVYISLEMIFKTLFTPRINDYTRETMELNDLKLCLVSNIINLAQHYRLYFAKKNISTEIYIYWNFPECNYINEKYIPTYKAYYMNKIFNNDTVEYLLKGIKECYKFLKALIPFINQVYLIDSVNIESSVLPYVIWKDRNDSDLIQNILVSNDKYDLQYVNYGFTILSPNGENSKLITKQNVIQTLKDGLGIKTELVVSTNYLPFILSILGNKYRNVSKITALGLAGVVKQINTAKEKYLVTDNTESLELLKTILDIRVQQQFCTNYHCTNIEMQYIELTPVDIHNVLSCIEDKYDDNTLLVMNDKYFQNHPLMMINMKSQQIQSKSRRNIFDR